MANTVFLGTGFFVPPRIVTNQDLTEWMDTSDAWIRERTGILERRWVPEGGGLTGARMASLATEMALEDAGRKVEEIEAIIVATLSPDHAFPGTSAFLQAELGLPGIPALDVRTQCTGFLYGLSLADAWIKTGQYRTVLLVGVEIQSTGLDLSTQGRDMAVLFGDGAGAALLGSAEEPGRGVLSTHLHADGLYARGLWCEAGSSSRHPRISHQDLEEGRVHPRMNGKEVFRHAVARMPEAALEALGANGMEIGDVDLLIAHQANARISEGVRRKLGLPPERMYNNIHRYGNTTGASIPIALAEAVREEKLTPGHLLCLVAFGSGFTWGSALVRW
jgi:3-oxoacyl-[acyl-carrier-protein] synthase-3